MSEAENTWTVNFSLICQLITVPGVFDVLLLIRPSHPLNPLYLSSPSTYPSRRF